MALMPSAALASGCLISVHPDNTAAVSGLTASSNPDISSQTNARSLRSEIARLTDRHTR